MNKNSYSEYGQRIFLALKGKSKEVQENTLKALYEMGTDGDFTSSGDKKIDRILTALVDDEKMSDMIGEVYDYVNIKVKKFLTKNTKNTKKNTRKNVTTRKNRRN